MTGLVPLLQQFQREKLAMMLRHQTGARLVAQYDANNTYQYIVNREEVQLTWLAVALAELNATAADDAEPVRSSAGKGAAAAQVTFAEDAKDAQAFVDRWKPRVAAMPNARHSKMLQIILGETLEQKRFFEQALTGRTDLLGRRGEEVGERVGSVMATRWIE